MLVNDVQLLLYEKKKTTTGVYQKTYARMKCLYTGWLYTGLDGTYYSSV